MSPVITAIPSLRLFFTERSLFVHLAESLQNLNLVIQRHSPQKSDGASLAYVMDNAMEWAKFLRDCGSWLDARRCQHRASLFAALYTSVDNRLTWAVVDGKNTRRGRRCTRPICPSLLLVKQRDSDVRAPYIGTSVPLQSYLRLRSRGPPRLVWILPLFGKPSNHALCFSRMKKPQ